MIEVDHEYYVSLDIAELLKEAGFDWKCQHCYFNGEFDWDLYEPNNFLDSTYQIAAPTLDVAQRWLREVKGIHICVKADSASINCKYFVTVIISDTKWGNVQDENEKTILFSIYEAAQEAGIQTGLTLLLEEKK